MYKKYRHKFNHDMIIEYRDDIHDKLIYNRHNFGDPIEEHYRLSNWDSWKQIEDWTNDNGWREVKELVTEMDYLNAFQQNFKYGG